MSTVVSNSSRPGSQAAAAHARETQHTMHARARRAMRWAITAKGGTTRDRSNWSVAFLGHCQHSHRARNDERVSNRVVGVLLEQVKACASWT